MKTQKDYDNFRDRADFNKATVKDTIEWQYH